MWLLKFHISVSILCWIAIRAMRIIFRDNYKRYKNVAFKIPYFGQYFMLDCNQSNENYFS
uniref:Uncharacterized protein n=1 Tax=Siphoviridae sp. ctuy39 TaxID=2825719 RepID=A0A8S5VEC3_9CAUD|nr:MAG TPA: hypothetical protein [Siphoviridae sp. ctuy39]